MVDYIQQSLSTRPIPDDAEAALVAIQRENTPVLKSTRDKVNSLIREQKQFKVTVAPPGSVGDYVSDGINDEAQLQEALNDASEAQDLTSRRVEVQPGTYNISNPIYVPTNVSFIGSGRGRTIFNIQTDFPDDTADGVVIAKPSTNPYPDGPLLAASARPGDNFILFRPGTDVSMFFPDDFALLESDDVFNDTTSAPCRRGEMVKINKIGVDLNGDDGSIVAYNSETFIATFETSGAPFTADMVGKVILIGNSATGGNNGAFTILSVNAEGDQITYFTQQEGSAVDDSGDLTYNGPGLSIYGMVRDTYEVSSKARARYIPWLNEIEIAGIEFRQSAAPGERTSGPDEPGAPCVALKFCKNTRVHDLYVQGVDAPGVTSQSCVQLQIGDCQMRDLFDFSSSDGFGNGIVIGDASEDVSISKVSVDRCRHGVDSGQLKFTDKSIDGTEIPNGSGVPRNVTVSTCKVSHFTDSAYSVREQGENWTFNGCTASNGDSYGFSSQGIGVQFVSCTVEYCTGGFLLGYGTEDSNALLGAGSSVLSCVVRRMKNVETTAADLQGLDYTGFKSVDGGGSGVTMIRVDHCTVSNNNIEFCGRAGIRIGPRATNNVIDGNTVMDCNQDQSGEATGNAIAMDDMESGDAEVTSATPGGLLTVKTTTGEFNASMVDALIKLSGFTTYTDMNQTGTMVGFTDKKTASIQLSTTGTFGAESGGTWEEEGASWNLISDNTCLRRSAHPTGRPMSTAARERDAFSAAQYGISLKGALSVGNMVSDNRCLGFPRGVVLDDASNTVVSNNQGSPEAQGIPMFSPATGVDIKDSDYLWDNAGTAVATANLSAPDPETGLQTVTDAAAGAVFFKTDVNKTITLETFADSNNNGRYAIRKFLNASEVEIYNPNGTADSSTVGRTWKFEVAGVQDGALSYHTVDEILYIRDGNATHKKVGGSGSYVDDAFEAKIEFTPTMQSYYYYNYYTDVNASVTVTGSAYFDPREYPSDLVPGKTRKIYFVAVMSSYYGYQVDLQLVNQSSGNAITGSAITLSSNSPTRVSSGALTVGTGTGDIQENGINYKMQSKYRLYADITYVHNAFILVRYE